MLRLILYDAPAELTEEKIRKTLRSQNGSVERYWDTKGLEDNMRFRFNTGKREQDTTHWVVEVEPELGHVLRHKNRVYIDARTILESVEWLTTMP